MNMKMEKQLMYQTSDLACAAALSLFLPLQDIDKQDPRRAHFIFERTAQLEGIIAKFQRRELQVEPRAYFDQIKALKTRLYQPN
jgi:hypothetical protein